MRSTIATVLTLGLLSACGTPVPNSGPGVGFSTPSPDQQARDAALEGAPPAGQPFPLPPAISDETRLVEAPTAVEDLGSDDIAAQTTAALAATGGISTPATVSSSQIAPAAPAGSGQPAPGISDEQDFEAVASRESIESDADRIAANRAQYQVVPPTELPQRPSSDQPNIVNYALSTDHAPGTRVYSRSGVNTASRVARNCARYSSPDLAQGAFLSSGGPQQDQYGLDPDGDGFACSWDPTPYRQAKQN